MIPKPNLDDRTFQDIVDEALRLIPQYCPEWNNFNASDPGVTLVELFAWMTEMMLYRLNRVPEKNLLTFLELMGVTPTPPKPAETILLFSLNEKADQVLLPARTRVETKPTAEDRPVVFETDRAVLATNNAIAGAFTQFHDQYSEHTHALERPGAWFDPFLGARTIERYLYIADERFRYLDSPCLLTVELELAGHYEKDLTRMLSWSAWDGQRWAELTEATIDTPSNLVAFEGPIEHEPTEVDGRSGTWIRAQLAEVPDRSDTVSLNTVRARVEVRGEGILPEHLLSNPEAHLFSPLDPDRNLPLFGKRPSSENQSAFYVACDQLLQMEDCTIKIEADLVEETSAPRPKPSEDMEILWEFYDGKRWRTLGKSGPGVKKPVDAYGFQDSTQAFQQNGIIRFLRPKNMKIATVGGIEALWIRCRLYAGDYGEPGTYELDGDRWVWREERPLRPPVLRSFALSFQEEDRVVQQVVSYNDFRYVDHSDVAGKEGHGFEPFTVIPEETPSFYLGFREGFPHDTVQIYVRLNEHDTGGVRGRPGEGSSDPDEVLLREQTLVWEYWGGKKWSDLVVEDETRNLTQSGFIRFIAPKDHRSSKRFGEAAFWIRVRLEMGGYHAPPRIENILLNAVGAANAVTYEESVLGSSEGTPNQSFQFPRSPVLEDEAIVVIEPERPSEEAAAGLLAAFGEEAVREHPDGGWRVRWRPVETFFEAGAGSRCYTKDIVTNRIQFGDGQKGMIPPKGDKNVRAAHYRVGGGEAGNVAANHLVVLRNTVAYVESVTNPYQANGGSDLESVDSVMQRGPYVLKSRNRAVTAEDFEWLAKQASPSVARVKCLPARDREGEVSICVVPRVPRDHPDFMEKPLPSMALLRQVKRHLNRHKLITTVLHVVKPRFVEFDVEVEVYRRASGPSDRLKRAIDQALRLFCHPLVGGRDRGGWPFGRSIYKVDLFHVVEEVPGVDLVHRIRLFDVRAGRPVDHVDVRDDELVFLRTVEVTERSREQIV